MATVGDASNYVYRKKRGGSCSLDHQDGGISSKEVVVTRNKDNARLYNFKAPFRGDEERVSRNYFSPYWKKNLKSFFLRGLFDVDSKV